MNFGTVFRAFDAVVALTDVAKRFKSGGPASTATGLSMPSGGGLTGHIEARLTNVVVAALKEAFDRDHARLELERAQLDEERRRLDEERRRCGVRQPIASSAACGCSALRHSSGGSRRSRS